MASDPRNLNWEASANAVASELPDPDPGRDSQGRELVRLLRTFGAFYNELQTERDFDAALAAKAPFRQPAPAAQAAVRIGGLLLTAKAAGSAGNKLVAVITPSTAASFQVADVDQDASQKQLQMALEAVDGVIHFLSDDPEVAAVQQQAAEFLKSLPDEIEAPGGTIIRPRDQAKQLISSSWDDSRVARSTLEPSHIRDDLAAAMSSMGVAGSDAAHALEQYDRVVQDRQTAALSLFTLNVSDGASNELYSDVPVGFPFPMLEASFQTDLDFLENNPRDASEAPLFQNEDQRTIAIEALNQRRSELEDSIFGKQSALLTPPAWLSDEAPPPGTYFFTGGRDVVLASSVPPAKDESEYVYSIAGRESFTLPELRSIVSEAMQAADAWVH